MSFELVKKRLEVCLHRQENYHGYKERGMWMISLDPVLPGRVNSYHASWEIFAAGTDLCSPLGLKPKHRTHTDFLPIPH